MDGGTLKTIVNEDSLTTVWLTQKAAQLLKRFTLGCLATDINSDTQNLLETALVSLDKIQKEMPITTANLFVLSECGVETLLDLPVIVKLFTGEIHLHDCLEKVSFEKPDNLNEDKNFQDRMKNIGIDLSTEKNRSYFLVADMGLAAEIVKIESKDNLPVADLLVGELHFINVAIPTQLKLGVGDKVITHNGFVICKINDKISPILEITSKQQKNHPKLQKAIETVKLTGGIIDFANFCPSKDGRSFDLTKRQQAKIN